VRGKAEKMGVKEIFIDDLREEFVRDYVFPMFRCGMSANFKVCIVIDCTQSVPCTKALFQCQNYSRP
jgi:argininosuccinate synthase